MNIGLSVCMATLGAATLALAVSAATPSPQPVASGPPISAAAAGENSRLAALSPAGMSTQEACTGFASLEECATALHLAHNLTIPFTDLRDRLTAGDTMAAALKTLKPDADANSEVRRAEKEARADARAPRG